MKFTTGLFALFLLFTCHTAFSEETPLTPEQEEYITWAKGVWDSLQPKTGEITLLDGAAHLNVPDTFYFLDGAEAKTVLEEVWNNPPGTAEGTLGMLFPAESTPFDANAWGVTIEYAEDGYVSDEDADGIDYARLLKDMQQDTAQASKARVQQGYESIELIGWAASPFYDKTSHKMHWAKEVKFGEQAQNTLNYSIRILGRKGVLVLNFIAGMDQKPLIDSQLNNVLAMAEFNTGSRYEDYQPGVDKVAAYGLGALITGGVLAKTGMLTTVLALLKKFGILIFVGLATLFGGLFRRKAASK